jgi:sporulation protein YlmC with PRC-barrel domain
MHTRRVAVGIVSLLMWAITAMPGAAAQDVPAPLQKMHTLIGHGIEDQNGQDTGHINDIVIDAATGDVAYVIVALGGVAGVGEKLFAIPWHILQQPANTDTLRLKLTTEQLKNAPSFNADKWPDMEERHWTDAVHAYYGSPPVLGKHLPDQTAQEERVEHVPHRFLRATYVVRSTIISPRGQRLGEIKDVVMDASAGQVSYVVLAFGGVIGLGEKLFAIPWQDLQQAEGLGTFTLDVDKDTLQAASGFDKDHWPKTAHSLKP